jgi:hypothetical protein
MIKKISPECGLVVVDTLKAQAGVDKKWVKAADALRAEGVTSDMLASDKEFRAYFKSEVILLSFSKFDQGVMAKPHTALSDEEKATKHWVQKQLGNRLDKVQKHVLASEKEESMTDEERGAKKVADMATRLKKDLAYWIEKIEKAEAVTFSAVNMVKLLKDASALIK